MKFLEPGDKKRIDKSKIRHSLDERHQIGLKTSKSDDRLDRNEDQEEETEQDDELRDNLGPDILNKFQKNDGPSMGNISKSTAAASLPMLIGNRSDGSSQANAAQISFSLSSMPAFITAQRASMIFSNQNSNKVISNSKPYRGV